MSRLGDLGSAADRHEIDKGLCTRCRHGYRQIGGDIDCRHAPHAAATPAAVLVRSWLWGQRGRDCPEFQDEP